MVIQNKKVQPEDQPLSEDPDFKNAQEQYTASVYSA